MNVEYNIRFIKHFIKKIIGKPDPFWFMFAFESKINKNTWLNRKEVLRTAEDNLKKKDILEKEELYLNSDDPLVRQGYELKQKIEKEFKDILLGKSNVRILIHVPESNSSPAGFSLFTNFAESFKFIGIPTRILGWDDSTKQALDEFKPNVFITSDYRAYLERIDWDAIAKYRENNKLSIGLTASPETNKPPLTERLIWAKEHKISFYYNYRDIDYTNTQKEYKPFFEAGYKALSIPFGANILHYYTIPDTEKDTNYAFIASTNKSKAKRYIKYMLPIVSKYSGLIDGPGWKQIKDFNFNRDRDRYVYARSKIGLNIHLEEQINTACEVNERTYQLAACGVPQIIDDAKILPKLFSEKALFVAKNPKEYRKYFEMIINNPDIGIERALIAQSEVFESHTTFHRVKDFIEQLKINNLVE
jgi:hypothetical protein